MEPRDTHWKTKWTMEITTVMGCKIHCRYCPQDMLLRSYLAKSHIMKMSFETFRKCIDKLPTRVRVDFSAMAEPWLNDECAEMVLYAAARGHKIAMYTTLVGMTSDDFDRIKDIAFEPFVLHLPDAEGNSGIPITADYLRLLGKVVATMTSGERLRCLGGSCRGPVHPELFGVIKPGIFDIQKNLGLDNSICDWAGNLQNPELAHRFVEGPVACLLCGRSMSRNVLLSDGTVLLCCMDWGMEHVLGNLLKDSYDDLFSGETMRRIRAALDDQDYPLLCRRCHNVARWHHNQCQDELAAVAH